MKRVAARANAAVVALALCLGLLPAVAGAEVGGLDASFGEGGFVTSPLDTAGRGAVELGVGPDGSVIVGDPSGYLLRFTADGAPDPGFGEGGRLTLGKDPLPDADGDREFKPANFVVDGAGRLLVFGGEFDPGHVYSIPGTSRAFGELEHAAESQAVVLRYDPEGKPDPSFGGDGFVRSAFGVRSRFHTDMPLVDATGGAVDSEGRPVFVVGGADLALGCYAGQTTYYPRGVVRLTRAGALDRSFGTDGPAPIDGSTDSPELGVDAADRPGLWVGPYPSPRLNCRPETALARLRADGGAMAGFGHDGNRIFGGESLTLAFVAPSGAMFLQGSAGRDLELIRVGLGGRRDKSFGNGGMAKIRPPSPTGAHAKAVGVDAKGRILLAGFIGPKNPSLVVGRLLPDGRLDRSFGKGGWIRDRVPGSLEVGATTAALDRRGRLLLATTVTAPGKTSGGYLLARFLLGS
jgi:uncharacterized delta-60 repeat protein